MKGIVFGHFDELDDDTMKRLKDCFFSTENERDRIFNMSERKLAEMKMGDGLDKEDIFIKRESLKVGRSSGWLRAARAAAACLALLVIGAAAYGLARVETPEPFAETAVSENLQSRGSVESYNISDSETNKAESDFNLVSDTIENHYESDKIAEREIIIDNQTETEIYADSEKEQGESDKSTERQIIIDAQTETEIYADSEKEQDESDRNAEREIIIDNHTETELYVDSDNNKLPSEDSVGRTILESDKQVEYELYEENSEYGKTTSERVRTITNNMTYREIIKRLGEPETLMKDSGYAQYIVDNSRLLMLRYDSEDDICPMNGEELMDYSKDISTMLSDPDNRTFDCFVVDSASMLVTCPQYYFFDCAYIHLTEEQRNAIDPIDTMVELRITHSDSWEESYPVGVSAESLDKFKIY